MRTLRRPPEGPEALAGKRFTLLSCDIRWRDDRYVKRRRSRPSRPPKPRPVLDAFIAVVASLIAGSFGLCMAFMLFGSSELPVYPGHGGILAAVMLCSLLMGPRDRGGVMITAGLALVWSPGPASLYVVRADTKLRPDDHRKPAAVVLGREPS